MPSKKEPPILEGEIVNEKKTAKSNDKDPNKAARLTPTAKARLIVIVVIIFAGAGTYLFWPSLSEWVAGWMDDAPETTAEETEKEVPDASREDLASRLATLEDRMTALENRPAPQPDPALEGRIGALEEQMSTLSTAGGDGEPAAPNPVLQNRLSALEDELETLKQQKPEKGTGRDSTDTMLAQAVAQLAPALYRSRPYQGELERVRVLALELPSLDQTALADIIASLAKHSATGIPARSHLQDTFEPLAMEALKEGKIPEEAGWWGKTWARLKNLVVIRRTTGSGEEGLESSLEKARQNLDRGNLMIAIETIEGLPPRQRRIFDGWLVDARARAETLNAYTRLANYLPRHILDQPVSGE